MKLKSRLFALLLGVFVFAAGVGFLSPQPAAATHCHSEWSCGCAGNPSRAFEKVYCDGKLVSTKCYNYLCGP